MKKVSATRRKAMAEYAKVREAFIASKLNNASKATCERCNKAFPAKTITIHHKRGRIGALLCDTRHWSLLCLACHHWVGDHPKEAREAGLMCEKGLWNTPDRS